jgi:osmotically-inducible protein OsmY
MLAYFLDPDKGTRRRNVTRDRLSAVIRRFMGRSGSMAQNIGGQAYGLVQETVPHRRDNPNPDDRTLKDRIESEVFRNRKYSRESLNVDVADGVVELRGELPSESDIDDLIGQVKSVPDVREVVSYLHLPNTPAPNKESALRVTAP